MPQTLKGFQDLLPEAMGIREAVLAIIRDTYARFGFQPLDTPVLERLDTLTGATEGETGKQIFTLETPESEAAALRFDLTVPFARVVSQYRDRIRLPFRRCHIGPVFRADKPGPGRFRQFTQCDIDIAGAATVDADAEVIATLCEAFRALGLGGTPPKYRVRVSSRKLVDALLRGYGVTDPATLKHTLRVMDKLQKVGLDNVRLELGPGRVDDSGDPIPGVGLESALIDRIADFVGVTAPDQVGIDRRRHPRGEAAAADDPAQVRVEVVVDRREEGVELVGGEGRTGLVELGGRAVGFDDRDVHPSRPGDGDRGVCRARPAQQGLQQVPLGSAGGKHGEGLGAVGGQRAGDVDALAARVDPAVGRPVDFAVLKSRHRDGAVDARVGGEGDDHPGLLRVRKRLHKYSHTNKAM